MADVIRELKAMKPDEPDEDIVKAVSVIRQQNPSITDDQIIEQARVMVSGGKPDFTPKQPMMPSAPPAPGGPRTTPPSGGMPSPAPSGPPAGPSGPSLARPSASAAPLALPQVNLPDVNPDQPDKITGNDAAIAALQGLAGVGDALATGYGGVKTDFMKTAMASEQQSKENRLNRQKLIAERLKAQKDGTKDQLEAMMKGSKDRFEMEEKLRDGFTNATKNFAVVRDQYGVIQASAKDPSAAGDISVITAYMKLIDPGSTVREGEFANAASAAGLSDRIVAQMKRVDNGERLSPDQRADFVAQAGKLFGAHEKSFKATRDVYGDVAKQYGLDPEQVTKIVVNPEQEKSTVGGTPTVTSQAAYDALPAGGEFLDAKGVRRRKPK